MCTQTWFTSNFKRGVLTPEFVLLTLNLEVPHQQNKDQAPKTNITIKWLWLYLDIIQLHLHCHTIKKLRPLLWLHDKEIDQGLSRLHNKPTNYAINKPSGYKQTNNNPGTCNPIYLLLLLLISFIYTRIWTKLIFKEKVRTLKINRLKLISLSCIGIISRSLLWPVERMPV